MQESGQFCGTVYRDSAHQEYLSQKEISLGRKLDFSELHDIDQEWYALSAEEKARYEPTIHWMERQQAELAKMGLLNK